MAGVLRAFGFLLLSLLMVGNAVAEEMERPWREGKYEGPIIDAHNHPNNSGAVNDFLALAEKAGVEAVIVMVTPNWYRKGKAKKILKKARRHSMGVALCSAEFVGHSFKGRKAKAQQEIDDFAAMLNDGRCNGIGELGIRHYDKTRNGGQPEVLVALEDGFVDQALALADRHGAAAVFHIEPVYVPKGIDNTEKIKAWYAKNCKRYPKARLVAAHTGMMSAANVDVILEACGNVFMDFKFMHNEGSLFGFQDLYPINDLDFRLYEPWAALMEKYPGRFVFGSDWKFGKGREGHGDYEDYPGHIEKVRRMIGSLRADVQEKVLYSNAKRVFGLQ